MTDYVDAAQRRIAAERKRQITGEGWDLEHDDHHDEGEMLHAALIYMHWGTDLAPAIRDDGAPLGWPWDVRWWKPKDRKRNLERAGALMLAERERLNRVIVRPCRAPRAHPRRRTRSFDGLPAPEPVRRGLPTGHVDQKLDLCIRALAAEIELGQ